MELTDIGTLLLYYIIIYQLYLIFTRIKLSVFGFIILNTILAYTLIIGFYFVDCLKMPTWFYDRKIQKDVCLDIHAYNEIIWTATLKYIFIYGPFTLLLFWMVHYRNQHFPGLAKVKITFIVFSIFYYVSSLFSEVITYFIHRALHTEYLFRFHKSHHDYIAPVAAATYDSHAVSIFFWDMLPSFMFALVFGLNVNILYVISLTATLIAILAHCGYRLLDSKVFDNAHHDLHHERMKCNYSSPIVDSIMGTYIYREPGKIYPKYDKNEKDISNSNNNPCD